MRRFGYGISIIAGGLALGGMACPAKPPGPTGPNATNSTAAKTTAPPAPTFVHGKMPKDARVLRPDGHLGMVGCVAFSPDGRLLVSGSADATLLVWDVNSQRIMQRLDGHSGFVRACAFLPDGRRVVSGGSDGEIFVWDVMTGARGAKVGDLSKVYDVYSFAVSSDGSEVLVGTQHGVVGAWSLHTGLATMPTSMALPGPPNDSTVWAVGFLGDGNRFAAGNQGVVIWDKQNMAQKVNQEETVSAAILRDNRLILGHGGYIEFPGSDGKRQDRGKGYLSSGVYGVAPMPHQETVLAADITGGAFVLRLADDSVQCTLNTSADPSSPVQAKPVGFFSAAVDPRGTYAAFGSGDGSVWLARIDECRPDKKWSAKRLLPGRGRIGATAASNLVLLGDGTGQVTTWDPATWQQRNTVHVHNGEVYALAISSNGTRWYSGGGDFQLSLNGKPFHETKGLPYALGILPDGQSAISVDDKRNITQVTRDGQPGTKIGETQSDPLYAIAVRPGKNEFIAGGNTDTLLHFTLPYQDILDRWKISAPSVRSLAYDPSGEWFVEGSATGAIALHHANDGSILPRAFEPMHGQVHGLAVTREHIWVGDRSARGYLVRHRLAGSEQVTKAQWSFEEGAPINDMVLTSDLRFLIVGLNDGRAAVHTVPDAQRIAQLIPFADGRWATLFEDHYEASDATAAHALFIEDPATHVITHLDGEKLKFEFTDVRTNEREAGIMDIDTTVFSPRGVPTVWLDDRWRLESVVPSNEIGAYNVHFSVQEPLGTKHTLRAVARNDETTNVDFTAGPDFHHARALFVAHQHYGEKSGIPEAKWAEDDATNVAKAFQRADSWGLEPSEKTIQRYADKAAFLAALQQFFGRAQSGETLLFYYAGHGFKKDNQGYLVPVGVTKADLETKTQDQAVSAEELWALMRDSKAARILVVLDACYSGDFLLPGTVKDAPPKEGDKKEPDIGILAATNADEKAIAKIGGSPFTRAIVGAMQDKGEADPITGAVRVADAYARAVKNAAAQQPVWRANLSLLFLSRPQRDVEKTVPFNKKLLGTPTSIESVERNSFRSIVASGKTIIPNEEIVVNVFMGHDTPHLHAQLSHVAVNAENRLHHDVYVKGASARKKVRLRLPIKDLHGVFHVHIEPCNAEKDCPTDIPIDFDVPLP